MKKHLLFFLLILSLGGGVVAQNDTIALKEVEIIDNQDELLSMPLNTIQPAAIDQTSVIDVGKILSNIPNISGIKKGGYGFDPVVRGFKYSQLNVILNGTAKIEGGCPNRMDPATTHVNANEVTNMTVYKGPYALKYGPAFGGVINISTWQPHFTSTFSTHLKGIVGLQSNGAGYNSDVTLEGAGKNVNFVITAGTKKYDDYQDGDGRWVKASLQQYHAAAGVGFKLSSKSVLDARADFSRGRNVDFPALSMDERQDNTSLYSVNYRIENVSDVVNAFHLSGWLSNVNHKMDNKNRPVSDTVVAVSSILAVDAGMRGAININMSSGQLESGFDYEHIFKDGQRVKSMIKQPGLPVKEESVWSDANIDNMGVYSQYRQTGNSLDWVVAGRVDFNRAISNPLVRMGMNDLPFYYEDSTASQYLNVSFSGGITWKLNDNNRLVFSIGRGVRSPDMTERFIILLPVGYDKYDYLGNPQLKPEINNEADIGLKHLSANRWYFDGNLFLSYVTHFIGSKKVPPSIARPQTKGVLGVKQFVNFDAVWLTGFEASLKSPEQNLWQLGINAAYTYGFNPLAPGYKIENGQVVDEYTLKNDPLPEIPPFETDLMFQYKFFHATLIPMIRWRVVAAQNAISQSYGEQESRAFQTVDVKINYLFSKNLSVWGGVNNLLNTTYYEHLNRNIIGSSQSLYEPGRNFFINFIFNF